MKRTAAHVIARLAAALALIALISGAALALPSVAKTGPGFAWAETTGSASSGSTADTSTVTSSTATTSSPKPKPKDTRPKAPRFMPKRGKSIWVDRKHQRVYFYLNGRQVKKCKCSTSRTLPRVGKYHMIGRKKQSWALDGSSTFYFFVIFAKSSHGTNIGFHSIPRDSSGHEIAPVGKPVSHGCVRLPYKVAKWLYKWMTKKTLIVVRA